MSGYDVSFFLYSSHRVMRKVSLPSDITLDKVHDLIQKLFNFDDYHNFDFHIPEKLSDEEVNLANIIRTINMDEVKSVKLSDIYPEYNIISYIYDYGDNWEIILSIDENKDYKGKTALIIDYDGKYGPMDDMGGVGVFDEIMDNLDDVESVLDVYGMSLSDLNRMDFEKKYEKGSRIRL